jgi:hypothetical protein
MLRVIDAYREESIRRWPVWVARLANRVIGWTSEACAAECGYPVTRRFSYELEVIGNARVVMLLCSVGGVCEERLKSNETNRVYSGLRPGIVALIEKHPETAFVPLSHAL